MGLLFLNLPKSYVHKVILCLQSTKRYVQKVFDLLTESTRFRSRGRIKRADNAAAALAASVDDLCGICDCHAQPSR